MTTPAVEPSHFGICVSDLERTLRFYCEGLGFEQQETFDLDSTVVEGLDRALEVGGPAHITSQWIQLGDMRIELLQFLSHTPQGAPSSHRDQLGITHLSFYVDDVDAYAKRLTEFGGTILDTTRSAPGIELIFLSDPDGVRVELMGRPRA